MSQSTTGYVHIALLPVLLMGCAANLKAPALAPDHPANVAATESSLPTPSPTLKSYRTATATSSGEGSRKASAVEGMDHGGHSSDASTTQSAKGKSSMKESQTANADRHETHAGAHKQEGSAAGRPGDINKVSREIKITAQDSMRYDPSAVSVQAGETIRFVVTNAGQVSHEFVIGDIRAQKDHAEMMRKMPNMKHAHDNALSLAPGETKVLLWQFGNDGELEIACHVAGHYEAGMRGKVLINKEDKHDDHKH